MHCRDYLCAMMLPVQVSSLSGQLTAQVLEDGDNFSAGERQLLCLARVLLRQSRVSDSVLIISFSSKFCANTDNIVPFEKTTPIKRTKKVEKRTQSKC